MTPDQILLSWGDRWRNLRAWGRSLDNVQITISPKLHANRLGTCWARQGRITIYAEHGPFPHKLKTLLHELAHAVTIAYSHGAEWQRVYGAAVSEVTGIQIPGGCEGDYSVLDRAAEDALSSWWKSSGNDFAFKLLTKKKEKETEKTS